MNNGLISKDQNEKDKPNGKKKIGQETEQAFQRKGNRKWPINICKNILSCVKSEKCRLK